jgi:hypothetical protein
MLGVEEYATFTWSPSRDAMTTSICRLLGESRDLDHRGIRKVQAWRVVSTLLSVHASQTGPKTFSPRTIAEELKAIDL